MLLILITALALATGQVAASLLLVLVKYCVEHKPPRRLEEATADADPSPADTITDAKELKISLAVLAIEVVGVKVNFRRPQFDITGPKIKLRLPNIDIKGDSLEIGLPKVNFKCPKVSISKPKLNISRTDEFLGLKISRPELQASSPMLLITVSRTASPLSEEPRIQDFVRGPARRRHRHRLPRIRVTLVPDTS